jgi:hypothetical protein
MPTANYSGTTTQVPQLLDTNVDGTGDTVIIFNDSGSIHRINMAYFAKLGKGNIVEKVISINNAVITDANGVEQEQLGNDFINKLYNTRDVWKQTSYNNNIRKNFAGIGYQYDQS